MENVARVILQIRWGLLAFRKVVLSPGMSIRVGRGDRASLIVAHDGQMSALHFEVAWDGTTCTLKDLESARGTQVDGERKSTAELHHGSWITAGTTNFSLYFEGITTQRAPTEGPELPDLQGLRERALEVLNAEHEPLFAMLDAARDDRILELLRVSPESCTSLYTGVQGDALEDVAPYLVALPKGSWLLQRLVLDGWSRSWGVYFTCRRPFRDVRDQLRRFLMVTKDDTSQQMYFRYYDPRVLRVYLPTCTPRQRAQFFGETSCFLLEGEAGEMLRIELTPASEVDAR